MGSGVPTGETPDNLESGEGDQKGLANWMDAWNQSVQEWDGGGRAIQEAKQPVSGRRGDEKKRREKEYRSLKGRKEVIMMTTLWRRREERRDDEEEEEEEEEEDKLRETRDGAEQAAASDTCETRASQDEQARVLALGRAAGSQPQVHSPLRLLSSLWAGVPGPKEVEGTAGQGCGRVGGVLKARIWYCQLGVNYSRAALAIWWLGAAILSPSILQLQGQGQRQKLVTRTNSSPPEYDYYLLHVYPGT
ncbi:hypothetical protein RJZ57_004847 [Blastomyces gilchristii]